MTEPGTIILTAPDLPSAVLLPRRPRRHPRPSTDFTANWQGSFRFYTQVPSTSNNNLDGEQSITSLGSSTPRTPVDDLKIRCSKGRSNHRLLGT
ncbi:MAG: hypothetical protein U0527_01090 [Candidatus Eisenbacteria bacterium]